VNFLTYRAKELDRMRLAFYGFDPSYHMARWPFITREPIGRTPLHLAHHRLLQASNTKVRTARA
jgi:putative two-component system hydrogenase maturation factor HypX/HoxX